MVSQAIGALLAILAGVALATQEGPQSPPPPPGGHFLFNYIAQPRHPVGCPTGCKGFAGDYGKPGHRGPQGMPGPAGSPGIPGYYVTYSHGHMPGMPPEGSVLNENIVYAPYVKGPPGELGDAGPPGANGVDGKSGDRGGPGRPGRIGQLGMYGDAGFPGPDGDTGASGSPGLKGAMGPLGYRGPMGPTGVSGPKGGAGFTGPSGQQGYPGQRGERGTPGVPGEKGSDGDEGPDGGPGPKGLKGSLGARGVQGVKGAAGSMGLSGIAGPKGDVGRRGITGSTGSKGGRGLKGVQGLYIEKVGVNETVPCDLAGRSRVKYDPFVKKLYYCNGNNYQCVESDPCRRNCQVGAWEPWQACSAACGPGERRRHRQVMLAAGEFGTQCPDLMEMEPCDAGSCSCATPSIANGRVVDSVGISIARDSQITWECNPTPPGAPIPDLRFRLVGASISRCLRTGEFDSLPTCEAIICPDPGPLENGVRVNGNGAAGVGNSYTHRCLAGYTLVGEETMTCRGDGAFDNTLPRCEPRRCASPGTLVNGNVNVSSGAHGDRAGYVCNVGFNLLGSSTRLCDVESGWQGPRPVCSLVSCGDPGMPQFGFRRGDVFTFTSDVSYSCSDGYVLSGSRSRHCQADGTWSGEDAVCTLRVCPQLTAPAGGTMDMTNDDRVVGTLARFACTRPWHELVGAAQVLCGADGVWSGPEPTCQAIRCCSPIAPQNGGVQGGPEFLAMRDTAVYDCFEGYRLIGASQRRCLTDGWSDPEPTCEPVMCGDPGVPANGQRLPLFGVFLPANKASFECNVGFRLRGLESLTCLSNGQWDGPPPTCEVITCPPPPIPDNGQRSGTDFTYSYSLEFSCNPGFSLRGSETRTCQLNGEYDGEEAFCDPDCVLNEFGGYSQCSVTCGPGTRSRSRTILQEPSGAGKSCDVLTEQEVCNLQSCISCENGAYTLGDSAFVQSSSAAATPGAHAADVLVVMQLNSALADARYELRRFLAAVESDLVSNRGTGANPLLPNRYYIFGFGGTVSTNSACGHSLAPQQDGADGLTFDQLPQRLIGDDSKLSSTTARTDGYEAILHAIRTAGLRHSPNIAHNLIFLANSSRSATCSSAGTDAKEQVRSAVLANGFTANFIVDHRIQLVRDKSQEVLGVRTIPIDASRRVYIQPDAFSRSQGYTEVDPVVEGVPVDYETHAFGTTNEDYTQLALDLGGVVWNMNNFVDQFEASSRYSSFRSAFTTIKAREMESDAKSCKLCTCTDGGDESGLFRCEQQANQNYCLCREQGGADAECQRS